MSENISPSQVDVLPLVDTLTFERFRVNLIDLHNQLLPSVTPLTDFDANKNLMGVGIGGSVDGAAIRYPRKDHKEELLAFAVEKAGDCKDASHAALLLSASVVAIHPFLDGNGRVSRALYSELLGWETPDEASSHRQLDSGVANREKIDLGTAFTQDEWLAAWSKYYPFHELGLKRLDTRAVIHKNGVTDELEAIALSSESTEGLDSEERTDLIEAIGGDEFGNTYRKDQDGLSFALDVFIQRYPETEEFVTKFPGNGGQIINIHELLPSLTKEQKKEFVALLWEYRKLRAKATIDFLSDDIGNEIVDAGGKISLRDLVIERTNNLHSSNIKLTKS